MKKILFSLLLLSFSTASFSTTHTITNNLDVFVPLTLTIALGDSVLFSVAAIHQPVEVDQTTWNANGSTPLPGGFNLPLGGGLVLPAQLGVGTHYYVCSIHVALFGMKGVIIVQNNAGIVMNPFQSGISVSPNPVVDFLTIKASAEVIGSQYFITDQAGRQVSSGKLSEENTPVDLSQLSSGIYMIQLVGNRRSSIKIIKN